MFGSYLTFTEYGYPHPSGPAYDLVFQQAPDLRRILGFDEIQASGRSEEHTSELQSLA